MPWKETNVMDQKLQFVLKSFEKEKSFTQLCTEYCISTKTGYKWQKRFIQDGVTGLHELSRKPQNSPNQYSEEVICELIRIKQSKKSWGPKKIREVYARNHPNESIPARSTVERILEKAGFVMKKRKRPVYSSERIQEPITPENPNDLWTVDFKGWWYTQESEKCDPLTVRDEFSKYILSIAILEKGDISCVKKEFERIFNKYGLPNMIKSDNGPPFASSKSIHGLTRLSAWWLSLGIKLDRIDPGKPYQNGAHERMHLDMSRELEGKIAGNLDMHRSVFETWRKEFNDERPHESLDMKTPAEFYEKSKKVFDDNFDMIQYPQEIKSRQVNDRGYISYNGRRVFISNALGGFNVGIKMEGVVSREVWLNSTLLGEIDLQSYVFNSRLKK